METAFKRSVALSQKRLNSTTNQLDLRNCDQFIGGFLGIALGVLISEVVSQFGGWLVVITSSSILLAITFSSASVFFCWYTARKVAALNQIDALRYE